ncbi:MAG: hypothetical protein HC817_16070 [Saprospiraceae bacterium]|nr:hypothetical protein [Saprospiraceae bacterium]
MRKFTLFLFALFLSVKSEAQYFETGLTAGLTSYIGDLQPGAPNNESFGLTYGALLRYNLSPRLAVKLTGIAGEFYANDRYAKSNRRFRNLEVQTQLYEVALTGEFNLNPYDVNDNKRISSYLFAGVAGLYFNPQARTFGAQTTWHDLQPLNTEGVNYGQFQAVIPFGVGLKLSLTQRLNLNFEAGFRFTFTDYLDDVSGNYPDLALLADKNPLAYQLSFRTPELKPNIELPSGEKRGDSYKRDMYYFVGATLSFNLANRSKMEFNEIYRSFQQQ